MFLIKEYDERYRPYDKSGGELRQPEWVKMPCKPKGDGLQALFEYPQGLKIFGIWCLLLQKATKEKTPENRGKLLNHKGLPATIPEIAKSISLTNKTKLVETAINVLVEMGWVTKEGESEVTSANFRKTSAKSRVPKSRVLKSNIYVIFDHWNLFKGQGNWKSHREVTAEIKEAINERLKKYSIEQLNSAITNYADILLEPQFVWSKNWTLREFFTRHRPDDRNELQIYRFLENNFSPDDFKRKDGRRGDKTDRSHIRQEFTEKIETSDHKKLIAVRQDVHHKDKAFLIDELRPEIKDEILSERK